MPSPSLPSAPPFVLRCRVLTPLSSGETLYLDDARLEVGRDGRIVAVGDWPDESAATEGAAAGNVARLPPVVDVRPWVVMPGLVDLHTHIPQLPNAGVGDGLDLLAWLDRYTLPLEARFDRDVAARQAPLAFAAMAAAGTTTVAAYATTDPDATDAVFAAAEEHGIRLVAGLVLMDRPMGAGPAGDFPSTGRSLRASDALCSRWHGRDGGRIRYAYTPRFAVSCSREMLRESARLAGDAGAHWQTHLSEDTRELEEVRAAFPEARDYLDVYERAGALELGPAGLFAHAIHLSESEVGRLAESRAAIAHCPGSNLFLPSGIMPLARYLAASVRVGLGSDVSGGPTLSIFETMRVGAYADTAMRTAACRETGPRPAPFDWLRLGTLDGARAIGLDATIGSLEPGKDADLIAVDASLADPLGGCGAGDDPAELMSRLIFRTHPEMVQGAWVRGRCLPVEKSGKRSRTSRHLERIEKPSRATSGRRTQA